MKQNFLKYILSLLRNPMACFGLIILTLFLLIAIFAPIISPYDPGTLHLLSRIKPGFWSPLGDPAHILGTDHLGRDILSWIIHGARVTLFVGLSSTIIMLMIGTILGACAGYFRGTVDHILSRFVDWLMAFPNLLLLILLMSVLGPGLLNLIVAISVRGWINFFRLVRSEILAEREKAYVESALAIGRNSWSVMFLEILPNISHSIIVMFTLRLGAVVLAEASLSFLGLGVGPGVATWGSMISFSRGYINIAWWMSILPGLCIFLLIMSLNLVGEGLRDVLDPRLRQF